MHAAAATPPPHLHPEPASFRDPAGRVFYRDGVVYRGLTAPAVAEWQALETTNFFAQFVRSGKLIETACLESVEKDWAAVLRHQTIPVVSYPHEWCFGMLRDAALLQLELLASALTEGMILKDGAAVNVQWHGARPVFIDVPSLIRWPAGSPWMGYRQFCQTNLFPLMLQAYRGVPFQPWLRGRLEGISAAECNALLRWRDLFRPGVLLDVCLQTRMERRHAATTRDVRRELIQAGFHKGLIQANVRRLTKVVTKLRWRTPSTVWTEYDASTPDHRAKHAVVEEVLGSRRWNLVWDLGANQGQFARLAAAHAQNVVALDADAAVVERLYQNLKTSGPLNVLPLVGDVADPSPGLGWRGRECRPLPDRGRPDLILCLALMHHLALSANVPVRDLIHWLADQAPNLVLEFPTRADPKVQQLLRCKDHGHSDYDLPQVERWLQERFDIRCRRVLPSGTRVLFHATAR